LTNDKEQGSGGDAPADADKEEKEIDNFDEPKENPALDIRRQVLDTRINA
jgi:hypothetical protein